MILSTTFFIDWLHHPLFYKTLHSAHHKSVVTSSWTSSSFNLLEALSQAILIVATTLIVQPNLIELIICLTIATISAVINHMNHEFYPDWLQKFFDRVYSPLATSSPFQEKLCPLFHLVGQIIGYREKLRARPTDVLN